MGTYIDYLKGALDESWNSHPQEYERAYPTIDDKKQYYYKFLKALCEGKFDSVTRRNNYKQGLSQNFYNLLKGAYYEKSKGEAGLLNSDFNGKNINTVIDELSTYFLEIEKNKNKRSFSSEANWVDNNLKLLSKQEKIYLLNSVLFDGDFYNNNNLYNVDKDFLKLILVENAYRLYVTSCERSGYPIDSLLTDLTGKDAIKEANTNKIIIQELFSNIDDVCDFMKNLSDEDLQIMINLYVTSRRNKDSKFMVDVANTLANRNNDNRAEIFNQFADKFILQKIKNNNTFSY